MLHTINKFRTILDKRQKFRILIITVMMIVGAFWETLSVGLILPLVSAVTTPDIIESNDKVKWVCDVFDLQSSKTFMILVIGALILVYLFKNVYLFGEYYVQYRFICNNRFAVQRQLMEKYLGSPYEFFLYVDSGEILRTINSDTNLTFDLLYSILGFFTEAFVGMALVITIIITDPFMAFLTAGVLSVMLLIVESIVRPILKSAGKNYQKNASEAYKWILQSINGIKEIKISEKEDYFLKQFLAYGKKGIDSEKTNRVIGTIPRLSIEAVSMSAILGVVAILLYSGREIDAMLPQLAAFAFAAVRLMPSVNRMSGYLNAMAYEEPALDNLIETLAAKKNESFGKANITKKAHLTLNKQIELKNITYAYPNMETPVFSHANMEIPIGKSVGIVGTSGAGKTTIVDILLGLLIPQEGKVFSDGIAIYEDYQTWLSHISYIPQMIFLLDDTIRANVAFGIPEEEVDEKQVWRALEEAQLDEFVKGLPKGLDTTIGERGIRLSGGQRQRIGIAKALYTNPELLIFDEATSALDNETEAAVMESVNSLHGKKTMLIIAHRLGTIEGCDFIYRVESGKVIREK